MNNLIDYTLNDIQPSINSNISNQHQILKINPNSQKCFIYCRISSKNQKDGVSLDMQEDICKERATNMGLEIVDVYEEIGSAFKGEQKTLKYLIKEMLVGSNLLVYRVDRFSRNLENAIKLMKLLKEKNIKLISATETFDLETASGKKYFNTLLVEAQGESDRISERVTSSIRYIKFKGGHIGKPPLGFKIKKDRDGIRRLIKDGHIFSVIRQILRESDDNIDDLSKSMEICNLGGTCSIKLNNNSHNTRSSKYNNIITRFSNIKFNGKPLTKSMIRRIHKNKKIYME